LNYWKSTALIEINISTSKRTMTSLIMMRSESKSFYIFLMVNERNLVIVELPLN
jgi:hypothetical protein